jgi:hypothetical protein
MLPRLSLLLITVSAGLVAFTAAGVAQAPIIHWGSDTRAMSQEECVRRAKFALGEQGLTVTAETPNNALGSGENVSVLVTCLRLRQKTFISVMAASPDGGVAEQFRNSVRSLVMGPADPSPSPSPGGGGSGPVFE